MALLIFLVFDSPRCVDKRHKDAATVTNRFSYLNHFWFMDMKNQGFTIEPWLCSLIIIMLGHVGEIFIKIRHLIKRFKQSTIVFDDMEKKPEIIVAILFPSESLVVLDDFDDPLFYTDLLVLCEKCVVRLQLSEYSNEFAIKSLFMSLLWFGELGCCVWGKCLV